MSAIRQSESSAYGADVITPSQARKWIVVAVIVTAGLFTVFTIAVALVAFVIGFSSGEQSAEIAIAQERRAELVAVISSDPDRFAQLAVYVSSNASASVSGTVRSNEDRELLKEEITRRLGRRLAEKATNAVLTDDELAELRAKTNFRLIDGTANP